MPCRSPHFLSCSLSGPDSCWSISPAALFRYGYLMGLMLIVVFACGAGLGEAAETDPSTLLVDGRQPVDWVNPLIDTAYERTRWIFFASASRPFGMVSLNPDMEVDGTWQTGYMHHKDLIRGFYHVHAFQLGGIPALPTLGEMRGPKGSDTYGSHYSHDDEVVHPGYHAITLGDYGIRAELTSTTRVGMHRYTFTRAGSAPILFDLGAPMGPAKSAGSMIRRVSATEIEGYAINSKLRRRNKEVPVYFVARFDKPFVECGGWQGARVTRFEPGGKSSLEGQGTGGYARYDVNEGDVVQMKVGISYVSTEQARLNLDAELPHWDFDRVHRESRADWNKWLGVFQVSGGTADQKTRFYTDLWHVLLGRRTTSDVDGKYCDLTGQQPVIRQIPLDDSGKPLYDHFNTDAFWNTFWNVNIIWALGYPDITREWVSFLVDMYKDGGLIPRGPSGHSYTFVMISAHSTPFIVGAYMKGIRRFDVETAYAGMRKNAFPGGLMSKAGYEHDTCIDGGVEYYIDKGFIPDDRKAKHGWHADGVSQTLEYAYDDWCLAQMAKVLGKQDDYELFTRRAANYRNMFDPTTGFMRPRNTDGSWMEPFEPTQHKGYCEGTAWQYTFFVPHDVRGLAGLMGGTDAFNAKLNEAFERSVDHNFRSPYVNYGNQPSIEMAHLFNYSGAPWLSQKWVRAVKDKAFSAVAVDQGYGGDEDQGQGSGVSMLMALGLFQVRGGCGIEPVYEITSPIFDRITIELDPEYYPGKKFEIVARNNSPDNVYIQSARLDGKPLTRPWIYHHELVDGGQLELKLGPKPNRAWGSRPEDAPPSMSFAR